MKKLLVAGTVVFVLFSGLVFGQASTKRGLAYGHHSKEDLNALKGSVGWWYNWYHQPENEVLADYQNYGFDFAPMAWNGSFNKEQMRAFVQTHPNVKYLLGWNEPNFLSQANMTPSEAAAKWKDLEEIADEFDLELVGPAVNYCGDCVSENGTTFSDPIEYLDAFFEACADCRVDHIAIHCYMGNVGALQWYVGQFKKYGKPIWLTEFANWEGNPTLEQQKSFLIGAVDYLENDPDVLKYAWFTGRHTGAPYIGILEDGQSGELTDLGEIYVNMPTHNPEAYTAIPARIEAEQYNTMSGILLEATNDVSGFANVGYIEANDWMEYGIDVPKDTIFELSLRIASTAESSIEVLIDDVLTKTITLPNTGGWQVWCTEKAEIELNAGRHKLKLIAKQSGFNINWLELRSGIIAGVDEIQKSQVLCYPNPSTGKLFLTDDQITSVEILDVLGKSRKFDVTEGSVDIQILVPGWYFVRAKGRKGPVGQHVFKK